MAQDRTESTREPINYGSFINQFQLDTIKSMRHLERTYTKIYRQRTSILFNEICINIFIYIYLYIYVHICIHNYIFHLFQHDGLFIFPPLSLSPSFFLSVYIYICVCVCVCNFCFGVTKYDMVFVYITVVFCLSISQAIPYLSLCQSLLSFLLSLPLPHVYIYI